MLKLFYPKEIIIIIIKGFDDHTTFRNNWLQSATPGITRKLEIDEI